MSDFFNCPPSWCHHGGGCKIILTGKASTDFSIPSVFVSGTKVSTDNNGVILRVDAESKRISVACGEAEFSWPFEHVHEIYNGHDVLLWAQWAPTREYASCPDSRRSHA